MRRGIVDPDAVDTDAKAVLCRSGPVHLALRGIIAKYCQTYVRNPRPIFAHAEKILGMKYHNDPRSMLRLLPVGEYFDSSVNSFPYFTLARTRQSGMIATTI
jgi:hypothetical protein